MAGSPSTKKDPNAPVLSPLERHLVDYGPLRNDGSDKFWGFENVIWTSAVAGHHVLTSAVVSAVWEHMVRGLGSPISNGELTNTIVMPILYYNVYTTRRLSGNMLSITPQEHP